MSETCSIHIGCKINLYLEIVARRDDGYHNLRTLFFPLPEPHDTLHIQPAPEGASMLLTCSDPSLEHQGNILLKAYRAFSYVTCCELDIETHLEKGIPMGSGLGGGSADAASLLLYLNRHAGPRALSPQRLRLLAAGLGADAPFFLDNTPAWGMGLGDELTPAPEAVELLRGLCLVLVCPRVQVATHRAYAAWDATYQEKNTQSAPQILTEDGQSPILPFCVRAQTLWNSFETVIFPAFPELREIKHLLLKHGAAGALMSGSGSSVFAFFRNTLQAESVAQLLKRTYQAVFIHYF